MKITHFITQHFRTLKITVFWNVVPSILVDIYQHFTGAYSIHKHGKLQVQYLREAAGNKDITVYLIFIFLFFLLYPHSTYSIFFSFPHICFSLTPTAWLRSLLLPLAPLLCLTLFQFSPTLPLDHSGLYLV